MGRPELLIKIGGSALHDPTVLANLCRDLLALRERGVLPVLVHGGGPAINRELTARGIDWRFVEGQRVTTPEMMGVIESTLCGQVNRSIVRALNAAGLPAAGCAGTDGGMLLCRELSTELGRVGEVVEARPEPVLALHAAGFVPVVAPIGVGADGGAFNINADWAATRLAEGLGVKRLVFLTDQDGVLDAQGRPLQRLSRAALGRLIASGCVTGGMLAKVRAAGHALANGVPEVMVTRAGGSAWLAETPKRVARAVAYSVAS